MLISRAIIGALYTRTREQDNRALRPMGRSDTPIFDHQIVSLYRTLILIASLLKQSFNPFSVKLVTKEKEFIIKTIFSSSVKILIVSLLVNFFIEWLDFHGLMDSATPYKFHPELKFAFFCINTQNHRIRYIAYLHVTLYTRIKITISSIIRHW